MMPSELEDEMLAIEGMYSDSFKRLKDVWGKPCFSLILEPFPPVPKRPLSASLRFIFPREYPLVIPDITISNIRGLDDEDAATLLRKAKEKAASIIGSEMVHEIAEEVVGFLNRKHVESKDTLYEGMLLRNAAMEEKHRKEVEEDKMKRKETARLEEAQVIRKIDESEAFFAPPKQEKKFWSGVTEDSGLGEGGESDTESAESSFDDHTVAVPPDNPFEVSDRTLEAEKSSFSRYHSELVEIEELGKGGFGRVMKVENKLDRALYAVKQIVTSSNMTKNKTVREVTTLSRLYHKHVVRYYTAWMEEAIDDPATRVDSEESEESDDDITHEVDEDMFSSAATWENAGKCMLYIQMEYCDGKTLREAIDEGNVDHKEAWRLFRQILEALEYVHSQNVIHRDLKPSNVFLTKIQRAPAAADSAEGGTKVEAARVVGDVKLGDFGLAVEKARRSVATGTMGIMTPDTSLTKPYLVPPSDPKASLASITEGVGTYYYRAPEQAAGGDYDSKADIYSLGVILFEMCHPRMMSGHERHNTLVDVRNGKLPASHTLTEDQTRIIAWCMHANPVDRPTASQLLADKAIAADVDHLALTHKAMQLARLGDKDTARQMLSSLFDNTTDLLVKQSVFNRQVYLTMYNNLLSAEEKLVRDSVTKHIRAVFERHAAAELDMPVITASTNTGDKVHGPTLLDRSGAVAELPCNLTYTLAAFLGHYHEKIRKLKRYSIQHVLIDNGSAHYKQVEEANFDVVWPQTGNRSATLAIEAECLAVAVESCHELVVAGATEGKATQLLLRLGHYGVLTTALKLCGVSEDKMPVIAFKMSNLQRKFLPWGETVKHLLKEVPQNVAQSMKPIMELPSDDVSKALDALTHFFKERLGTLQPLGGSKGDSKLIKAVDISIISLHNLKDLVLHYAKLFKSLATVTFSFNILLPAVVRYNCFRSGLVFQLVSVAHDTASHAGLSKQLDNVLAEGGRFEKLVDDHRVFKDYHRTKREMIAMSVRLNVDRVVDRIRKRRGVINLNPTAGLTGSASAVAPSPSREPLASGASALAGGTAGVASGVPSGASLLRSFPEGGPADVLVASIGEELYMQDRLKIVSDLHGDDIRAEFLCPPFPNLQHVQRYCATRMIQFVVMLPANLRKQVKLLGMGHRVKVKERLVGLDELSDVIMASETVGLTGLAGATSLTTPSKNDTPARIAPSARVKGAAPIAITLLDGDPSKKTGGKKKDRRIIEEKIERMARSLPGSASDTTPVIATNLSYAVIREVVTAHSMGAAAVFDAREGKVPRKALDSGRAETKFVDRLRDKLEELRRPDSAAFVMIYSLLDDLADFCVLKPK